MKILYYEMGPTDMIHHTELLLMIRPMMIVIVVAKQKGGYRRT